MKFTENSLVVDVVKISNSSFKLSVPAGDLLTAAMNGAVLRRHDLSTTAVPNVLYVPLSEAKLSSGTYTFTFASGDKFTASAADAYPAASSVSDKTDSELPSVGTSDKNKYLHTNGSTGAVEWADAPSGMPSVTEQDAGKVATVNNSGVWVAANPSSGGGVLVVTDTNGTLDKTWQEIHDADFAVVLAYRSGLDATVHMPVNFCNEEKDTYNVACLLQGTTVYYAADSTSDYPTLDE